MQIMRNIFLVSPGTKLIFSSLRLIGCNMLAFRENGICNTSVFYFLSSAAQSQRDFSFPASQTVLTGRGQKEHRELGENSRTADLNWLEGYRYIDIMWKKNLKNSGMLALGTETAWGQWIVSNCLCITYFVYIIIITITFSFFSSIFLF